MIKATYLVCNFAWELYQASAGPKIHRPKTILYKLKYFFFFFCNFVAKFRVYTQNNLEAQGPCFFAQGRPYQAHLSLGHLVGHWFIGNCTHTKYQTTPNQNFVNINRNRPTLDNAYLQTRGGRIMLMSGQLPTMKFLKLFKLYKIFNLGPGW